jgi:glyoxylase-like metal-dependent hydrolase (beta-lactamase superfamily II)
MIPFWDWQLREAKEYYKDYRPLKLVNADITFSDTLLFHWGSQTIQMIFLPENAHAQGDVIAWIPEKKIVVTGDIVVAPTPYNTHRRAAAMVKALQRIIDMQPAIIIPGHGEVEYDLSYINLEKEAFTSYIREVENAVKNNVPRKEVYPYVKLDELDKKFYGEDEVKRWAYNSFFKNHIIYEIYKQYGKL